MNTNNLLKEIVLRINKLKILIIIGAVLLAGLFAVLAKRTKPLYTSKATVFPLTNPTDNSLTSSALSSLLGGGDAPKSFSSEASINIIELALSRNVRESVSAARIPEKQNKTVAELIIQEVNSNKPFYSKKLETPTDSATLVVLGGELLKNDIGAKINKNGVLELYFTNTDFDLIKPVSEILISKISQFYIDLRIAKATADYNFTLGKIDSIKKALAALDSRAVYLQNTTLFTPTGHLEYELPKENLGDEKIRAAHERDISLNNREEALWRLQKATPIIATLDKPNPPYDIQKPSTIIYAIIGFVVGLILMVLILNAGLLYAYAKAEINKIILGEEDTTTSVA